jgi:glutaredoxin
MLIESLDLEWTKKDGAVDGHNVTVYALSTCGFCKACLKFLNEKDVKFKYVYFDLLDKEVKDKLRDALKEKYNERIMFPFVVIDYNDVIVVFKQSALEEKLGI